MFNIMLEGITKSYHDKMIFQNINGQINQGDKIGLIGSNGVGKTTLAKIISQEEVADAGNIKYNLPRPIIVYLEQYPKFKPGLTVFAELDQSVRQSAYGSEDHTTIVKKMLNQALIPVPMWMQQAETLSGGEKTKLMLCKILVQDFDLLILDEPTNHLDLESATWLEDTVQKIKQTVLVISHNRSFLDAVTSRIWELSSKGLKFYKGNFTAYKEQKELEIKTETAEYEKQQAKIRQLKEMIRTRQNWLSQSQNAYSQATRDKSKKQAASIKNKEKELARLLESAIPKPHREVVPAFSMLNKAQIRTDKLAPVIIRVNDVCKRFSDKSVLQGVSFVIERGDKVALLGKNGAGKTTLLKLICGMSQVDSGSIVLDKALRIGYLAQEFERLNSEHTVLDSVITEHVSVEETRSLLACLLFRKNDVFKKISALSMGEKSRVAFAKLILCGANLLVLDEPTNYLDIASTERIEEVLRDYLGSVIFISHDKYLVQRVASKIMFIEDGTLKVYAGDYSYYQQKHKAESQQTDDYDYKAITDYMLILECDLAYLAGKLGENLDEPTRKCLSDDYEAKSLELTGLKRLF